MPVTLVSVEPVLSFIDVKDALPEMPLRDVELALASLKPNIKTKTKKLKNNFVFNVIK